MKKLIISTALLAVVFCSVSAQEMLIDKVVAKVGSELVLLSEVEEQYTYASEQRGGIPPEVRCQILEQIMVQKLLVNQAKLDSVEVGDAEVETQLDARFERILQMMGGDTKQFEDFYGQGIPEAREGMRSELKNQLLTDRMRSLVMGGIVVTPSEVKDFFARIPADSLPYFNSEVEAREIVMKPEVNAEEDAKARKQLEDIKQRIDAGEDFAELAITYSDDPGSGRNGGDLGMTKRGSFVPEFEAAAYSLENGGLSEIVRSEFGYHLIELIERRGNSIHARHILIKPEITYADMDRTKAKLDSVVNVLNTDSLPFEYAVKLYSNDKVQSYNNAGLLTNPKTGNTFFEIGDLETDIFFTIDTMEVGKVSQAVQFTDQRGEEMFRAVLLQSRTEPHKASLEQDYSKIQLAAINEKKGQFLSGWVEDKINSTFVNVVSNYETCPNLNAWNKEDVASGSK